MITDNLLNDQGIKVALNGQVERDTRIVFTYPEPYDPVKSAGEAWLRSIFDPREARNFAEAKKVYAFWHGPQGNYYGLIVPSPNDTRNGRLMITLFVGKRIIRSGKALEDVLSSLERMLIADPSSTTPEGVAQLLSRLVLVPDALGMKSTPNANIGYREVPDALDLDNILGNCDQREYCKFRRVLFVLSIYGGPTNPMEYTKITAPVVPYTPPQPTPKPAVSPAMPRSAAPAPLPEPKTSAAKIVACCIGGVAGLYILFAAICGFNAGVVPPFTSDKKTATAAEAVADTTSRKSETTVSVDQTNYEATDVAWMRENDTWIQSHLKSDKYRELLSFMQAGQIDQILRRENEWFAGQHTNSYWTAIMALIKNNPSKQSEMSGRMQSCVPNGRVILPNLKSELESVVNASASVAPATPSAASSSEPRRRTSGERSARPDKEKVGVQHKPAGKKVTDTKSNSDGKTKSTTPSEPKPKVD